MSVRHAFYASVFATTILATPVALAAEPAMTAPSGSSAAEAGSATVNGVIAPTGSAEISPDATIAVSLEDVSLADAPAITLGKSEFAPVGKGPYAYALRYDPSLIQPGHRYALRAEIRDAGKLIALSKTTPMQEGAVPADTKVSVDAVAQAVPASVVGAWTLTHIGSRKTDPAAPAFMMIRADGGLSGTGGCNRMMGRVSVDATHFTFGPTAGTRMACPGVRMTQEDAVFKAMQAVRSWKRESNRLILKDEQGTPALTLTLQKIPDHKASAAHTEPSRKS